MNHMEGNFKAGRGLGIYFQAWLPEEKTKAALLMVHGLGEHSGRYMNVVNRFVPLGYSVFGLDHMGHGKSEGRRAHVERFTDFTETLGIFSTMVKERNPATPVFIVGHSMGGLITALYLLDHSDEFSGAVISAPSIIPSVKVSGFTVLMGKILSVLFPKTGILKLDATAISRDPEVVKAYVEDPLVFNGKISARLAAEMVNTMERLAVKANQITLPLLIVQGTEDKLVDPSGARLLHERAGAADKTIKTYEGLYHELFNEPEREEVLNDVGEWLEAHIKSKQ